MRRSTRPLRTFEEAPFAWIGKELTQKVRGEKNFLPVCQYPTRVELRDKELGALVDMNKEEILWVDLRILVL